MKKILKIVERIRSDKKKKEDCRCSDREKRTEGEEEVGDYTLLSTKLLPPVKKYTQIFEFLK